MSIPIRSVCLCTHRLMITNLILNSSKEISLPRSETCLSSEYYNMKYTIYCHSYSDDGVLVKPFKDVFDASIIAHRVLKLPLIGKLSQQYLK